MADPAYKWVQGCTHLSLVHCRGIATLHGHHEPFVQAKWCCDSGQMHVVRVNSCLKE